jgi:hypothetical protein
LTVDVLHELLSDTRIAIGGEDWLLNFVKGMIEGDSLFFSLLDTFECQYLSEFDFRLLLSVESWFIELVDLAINLSEINPSGLSFNSDSPCEIMSWYSNQSWCDPTTGRSLPSSVSEARSEFASCRSRFFLRTKRSQSSISTMLWSRFPWIKYSWVMDDKS